MWWIGRFSGKIMEVDISICHGESHTISTCSEISMTGNVGVMDYQICWHDLKMRGFDRRRAVSCKILNGSKVPILQGTIPWVKVLNRINAVLVEGHTNALVCLFVCAFSDKVVFGYWHYDFEKCPTSLTYSPWARSPKMDNRYQKGALNWTLIFRYIMHLSTHFHRLDRHS